MESKINVLWVEDSARFELAAKLGPFYASHRYDLTLVEDASSAVDYLTTRQFGAIVLDIRLPPGRHPYWRYLYDRSGKDRIYAKLGLAIVTWLLAWAKLPQNGKNIPNPPSWEIRAASRYPI